MRKGVILAAALAALGVAGFAAWQFRPGGTPAPVSEDARIEAELRQAIEQLRPFPRRIDEVTELTDARVTGRAMTYIYRVSQSGGFDLAAQRAHLERAACDNAPMRAAITDHRVAFTYEYRSAAEAERVLGSVEVARCP